MEYVLSALVSNVRSFILLVVAVAFIVHSYLSHRRLAHIRGPRLAGWSSIWLFEALRSKKSHLEFYRMAQEYGKFILHPVPMFDGSIVRVQPNVLLTSDVELIKRMNAPRSTYRRSDWFIALQVVPGTENIISMRDNKLHGVRKAQLHNGYLGRDNIALEPSIDRNILTLLDLIRKKYVSSATQMRPMDLAEKAQFLTLDVGMDLATGRPLGDLEHDEDLYDYIKINVTSLGSAIVIGSVPLFAYLLRLPFIAKMVFPNAQDKIGFGRLIGLTQNKVAERFSSEKASDVEADMLQSFIKHGLNQEETVSESLAQVLAGSDTTATAIRTLMLYIMTSPRVYSKLNAEIDLAVRGGVISTPIIKSHEARNLPYLQAVIREGLRIFPPGTGLLPRQAPPEGDTFNGVFIPGGTEIGINIWAILRSTEVFGSDATAFRPERWLEASPEVYTKMERVQELVWGYGKFLCLGKHIALMQLNKTLVELLRNFQWELTNPTDPWTSACYGVFFMSDMWVRVTERGYEC